MKKNVFMIILLLIAIGLGGYVGYDYLTYKKDDKKVTEKNNNTPSQGLKKIEDTKELVYYETEKLGKVLFWGDESGCFNTKEELDEWLQNNPNENMDDITSLKESSSLIDSDTNITLKYPTINIDNDTVNNINDEIKKYIDEGKQKMINGEQSYGTKYTINGQTKYSSGFFWNEVEIHESNKYISIIFRNYSIVACGGWGSNVEKVKYLNKENGLETNEYDILEKYNYKNINDLKDKVHVEDDDYLDLSSLHSPYIDSNEKLHIFAVTNGDSEFIIENNELKEIN